MAELVGAPDSKSGHFGGVALLMLTLQPKNIPKIIFI